MNYSSIKLGINNYLAIPPGEASHLILGTSDFTIEAWVYLNLDSYAGTNVVISMDNVSSSGTGDWFMGVDNDSGGNLMFGINTTDAFATTGQQVPLKEWVHVAATRIGNTFDTWVNGIKSTSSVSRTDDLSIDGEFRIGRGRATSSNYWRDGWIAGLRVIIGEALYTSEFTPSAVPLTATANTRFLLSPEYLNTLTHTDISSYSKTFDAYGTVGMSTFNPWAEPSTVGSLADWNTIKAEMYKAASKTLSIPDDPIVDETVINTEFGFDSYTL